MKNRRNKGSSKISENGKTVGIKRNSNNIENKQKISFGHNNIKINVTPFRANLIIYSCSFLIMTDFQLYYQLSFFAFEWNEIFIHKHYCFDYTQMQMNDDGDIQFKI